jgi:hypothetical protein
VFSLGVGTHTIQFRAREADTPMSGLLITNDPEYVPPGSIDALNQAPVISSPPDPSTSAGQLTPPGPTSL